MHHFEGVITDKTATSVPHVDNEGRLDIRTVTEVRCFVTTLEDKSKHAAVCYVKDKT